MQNMSSRWTPTKLTCEAVEHLQPWTWQDSQRQSEEWVRGKVMSESEAHTLSEAVEHLQPCTWQDTKAKPVPCTWQDTKAKHIPCTWQDTKAKHIPCTWQDTKARPVPCTWQDTKTKPVPFGCRWSLFKKFNTFSDLYNKRMADSCQESHLQSIFHCLPLVLTCIHDLWGYYKYMTYRYIYTSTLWFNMPSKEH